MIVVVESYVALWSPFPERFAVIIVDIVDNCRQGTHYYISDDYDKTQWL